MSYNPGAGFTPTSGYGVRTPSLQSAAIHIVNLIAIFDPYCGTRINLMFCEEDEIEICIRLSAPVTEPELAVAEAKLNAAIEQTHNEPKAIHKDEKGK